MNFLNRLIPDFLKKLDKHLLLNNRLIWETKFHFVVFYGIIGVFTAFFIGACYPISTARDIPDPEFFVMLSAIPSFILLAFWIYKQYLHTIENNFGGLNKFMGQKRLLIYVVSAMLFIGPSLIMPFMIHNRIGNLASFEELEADRKILNEGNPFFPISSKYRYETDNIHAYFNCAYNNEYQDDYCDKGQIFTRFGRMESPMSYMSAEQLHKHFVKNLNHEAALTKIEKFIATAQKYGGEITVQPEEVLSKFVKGKQRVQVNIDKVKYKVARQLWDIEAHQYPLVPSSDQYTFWGAVFAFICFFSILIQLIKAVSMKDLIISVVSLVGIGITTVLLTITVSEFRNVLEINGDEFITLFALGLYAFALYHTAGISIIGTYSRFKTIMLAMVNLTTPFLVLWLAITGDSWNLIDLYPKSDELVTTLVLSGLVVYGLFFFPWFRKLHLRMHSLPKG
ncbi:MAG: hypothetical protein ACPGJS_12775 [Flammeovirgaceae bacterium]